MTSGHFFPRVFTGAVLWLFSNREHENVVYDLDLRGRVANRASRF
jgi:hypothetical protein